MKERKSAYQTNTRTSDHTEIEGIEQRPALNVAEQGHVDNEMHGEYQHKRASILHRFLAHKDLVSVNGDCLHNSQHIENINAVAVTTITDFSIEMFDFGSQIMSPVAGFAELVPKIVFEGNNHWNQLRDLDPAVGGNVLP